MKILFNKPNQQNFNIQTAQNFSKSLSFRGNYSTADKDFFVRTETYTLEDLMEQENFVLADKISPQETRIIKENIPALNKLQFTEKEFHNLSPKEIQILDNLINKGKKLENPNRTDLSIKKDAERILYLAKRAKNKLDKKYPQGYKLISIGNSPAPFVETMQLLGADTDVIPFSKRTLMGKFPFVKVTEDSLQKYSSQDWENYFKFFGITPDFTEKTGKRLIFTDYSVSGETVENMFKPMLRALGYPKDTIVADIYDILPTPKQLADSENIEAAIGNFNLANIIYKSEYKKYAAAPSAKNIHFDYIKHPELIKTLEPSIESKLLRYAIFKLIKF